MKDLISKNIKKIGVVLAILIVIYFIYQSITLYTENKIEKRINEEKQKIETLKQEAVYWKAKSEVFENESKSYKDIVEKSKQSITTIINKYDEKRSSIATLSDDESIKFLADRLNQKNSSR